MKGQRQRDTAPERALRRALTELGRRYRLHSNALPGRPDVSNRTAGWAIFVRGCFWHQHPGCPRATVPKNNLAWWQAKFLTNRARDARKTAALRALGLHVLEVWECETGEPLALRAAFERFFATTGTA